MKKDVVLLLRAMLLKGKGANTQYENSMPLLRIESCSAT